MKVQLYNKEDPSELWNYMRFPVGTKAEIW